MPESMNGGFNRSEWEYLLYDRYVKIWEDSLTEQQAEDAFYAVNFMYTPWPYLEDEALNRDAFVQASDVIHFRTHTIHVVKFNFFISNLF